MKTLLLAFIIHSFFFSWVVAQSPVFYENGSGEVVSEETYRGKLQDQIERLQQIKKNVHVNENLSEPFVRNDSTIIQYSWRFFLGSTKQYEKNQAAEAQFNSLLDQRFPFEEMARPPVLEQGKPVLLNLWFTTCAPCIAEMPVLNLIKDAYEDRVQCISILPDTRSRLETFLAKTEFRFFHYPDEKKFLKGIGALAYPQNLIIDSEGVVVAIEGGIHVDKHREPSLDDAKAITDLLELLLGGN